MLTRKGSITPAEAGPGQPTHPLATWRPPGDQGGRLAAKEQVSDDLLDRCKPIAGTPEYCIAAIEEYREAGCTHVMLELWGDRRHDQIRMFGERVLPHFR